MTLQSRKLSLLPSALHNSAYLIASFRAVWCLWSFSRSRLGASFRWHSSHSRMTLKAHAHFRLEAGRMASEKVGIFITESFSVQQPKAFHHNATKKKWEGETFCLPNLVSLSSTVCCLITMGRQWIFAIVGEESFIVFQFLSTTAFSSSTAR